MPDSLIFSPSIQSVSPSTTHEIRNGPAQILNDSALAKNGHAAIKLIQNGLNRPTPVRLLRGLVTRFGSYLPFNDKVASLQNKLDR